jgi:hypothetical protein
MKRLVLLVFATVAGGLGCDGCDEVTTIADDPSGPGSGGAGGSVTSASATSTTSTTGPGGAGGDGGAGGSGACEIVWATAFAPDAALVMRTAARGPGDGIWAIGSVSNEPGFGNSGSASASTKGDVIVARFDSLGQEVWTTSFLVSESAIAFDVQVDDAGHAVVVGAFEGTLDVDGEILTSAGDRDGFAIRLAPDGTVEWAKRFGDAAPQFVRGVALTPQGGVLLVGPFEGVMDFGGGALNAGAEMDAFVAELSSAGDHVWSQAYGGSGVQGATAIALDPAGSIVLTGLYFHETDFGDGPLPPPDGFGSGFLLSLDETGTVSWSRGMVHGSGFADVDDDGVVHLGGILWGEEDFGGGPLGTPGAASLLRIAYAPDGQHLWSAAWPAAAQTFVSSFQVNANGESWLSGTANGDFDLGQGPLPHGGGLDAFLVRFGADGKVAAGWMYGGAESQVSTEIAIIDGDRAVMTGWSYGPIDFCRDPLGTAGEPYGFLAEVVAP